MLQCTTSNTKLLQRLKRGLKYTWRKAAVKGRWSQVARLVICTSPATFVGQFKLPEFPEHNRPNIKKFVLTRFLQVDFCRVGPTSFCKTFKPNFLISTNFGFALVKLLTIMFVTLILWYCEEECPALHGIYTPISV